MKRYLLVVPALALLGATAPAPPKQQPARIVSPQPNSCPSLESIARGKNDGKFQRLGELPPGLTYMAVYRTDANGCIDPMLASEREGARR
jgi:hypothetical protein